MSPLETTDSPETDLPELARCAAAGDLAAYGRLVERTQRQIFAIALHVLGDSEAAADVTQETYLRAHRSLSTLSRPAAVEAWLRRIATNLAFNHQRARRRFFVQFEDEVHSLHDWERARSGDSDPLQALERALLTLSVEERRLCERFYRGGWSIQRLAADTQVNPVALRKRISRMRAQLRKEIVMNSTREHEGPMPGELPERIVSLLARPTLTDIPENPVGALWDTIRTSLVGYEEVPLSETVLLSDVESVVGTARMPQLKYNQHHIDSARVLRSDTSMPMMVELSKRPAPGRWMAQGKVYRNEVVDERHLEAFHQAEVLIVDQHANEWQMAEWLIPQAKALLHERKLKIEEIDFPFMCSRAFELHVRLDDEWIEVAAFGRFHDDIAERLGGPGQRAVGAGLGLERWAQLAYGIDDIRKIENAKVE